MKNIYKSLEERYGIDKCPERPDESIKNLYDSLDKAKYLSCKRNEPETMEDALDILSDISWLFDGDAQQILDDIDRRIDILIDLVYEWRHLTSIEYIEKFPAWRSRKIRVNNESGYVPTWC